MRKQNSVLARQLYIVAAIGLLSGCALNVEEVTNSKGQRSAKVSPEISLDVLGDLGATSTCRYRLSLNAQCYASLPDCRAAGDLRTKGGQDGYSCASDVLSSPTSSHHTGGTSHSANIFPDALITQKITLGMSQQDFKTVYPEAKFQVIHPRLTQATIERTINSPFMDKGMLVYIPQVTFLDDRLWGGILTYTFLGNSDKDTMRADEITRLQEQFRDDCVGKYGVEYSTSGTQAIPGGEVEKLLWNFPERTVTMSLIHNKTTQKRLEILGAVTIMTVRKGTPSAADKGTAEMKTTLQSLGIPTKP